MGHGRCGPTGGGAIMCAPAFVMHIKLDDLTSPDVHTLLAEHLRNMHEISPRESVHALDREALRAPDITFWTVWSDRHQLLGCGALKELDVRHGEVKSMRTVSTQRRQGVGRAMLEHIVAVAKSRSYTRLSLETGSMTEFEPARRLYEQFGFGYCAPFAGYNEDPNSVFMTLALSSSLPGAPGAPVTEDD
jgi:putative acetyltransferase